MRVLIVLILLSLAACGGDSPPTPVAVQAALTQAGASAFVEGRVNAPAPQSYTNHADFMIGDKGGQYFICDTKRNCDAIFAYFDAFKALVGPYLYQSGGGLVVAQLNSELMPDVAAKIEAALKGL